mgnify:CR=1 FL=1
MKTPEEWIKIYKYYHVSEPMFEEIQKDAWNAAIDSAAENAEVEEKLGNPYDINSAYWEVDKQSILKLKK